MPPKRHPAAKPLARQWSGRFVCGRCHRQYKHRCSWKRHKEACKFGVTYPKLLLKEGILRTGDKSSSVDSAGFPLQRLKPGPKAFSEYPCRKCGR